MFIGQIGQTQASLYRNGIEHLGRRVHSPAASKQAVQRQFDHAEIGAHFRTNADSGIYKPASNQMQRFDPVSSVAVSDDRIIQVSSADRIAPPSEQSSFTKEDALINQYMKQSQIEGYFDGSSFVQTSSGSGKLILKDQISKSDLEQFQSELAKKGLVTEIDWSGVRNDLAGMDVRFDNVEHFKQKADYLASRYAVLKDRIETQFTGEQQKSELQKLEQIYTEAKEKMADSYAENIGGFYEDSGQSGAADDMRNSVLALIDKKADTYTAHLAQKNIYEEISDPADQWLKQDDGYMAAKLRESVSEEVMQKENADFQVPYHEKDLSYAGIYAKELSQQLKDPKWDTFTIKENDRDLGEYLAEQYKSLTAKFETAGISDSLSSMLKDSFQPFMDDFMDALDSKIAQNRERIAKDPWQSGLIRTNDIDRESVYRAFQNAIS